jgi:hypothetical protein
MKHLKWNTDVIHCAYSTIQPKHHMWIGDTGGASCHCTNNHDCGMFKERKPINDRIGVDDGSIAIATKEGNARLKVIQQNGKACIVTLYLCKYIPNLPNNLFSITTALAQGWTLTSNCVHIRLSKHKETIIFNAINPTSNGLFSTVKMVQFPHQTKHHLAFDMTQPRQQPVLVFLDNVSKQLKQFIVENPINRFQGGNHTISSKQQPSRGSTYKK